MSDPGREWVAAVLRGDTSLPVVADDVVLATIDREWVAGLCHAALARRDPPHPLAHRLTSRVRDDVVLSLSQLAECRAIVAALAANDVPSLLLKGAAIAVWLYVDPHLRRRGDIDLWVRTRGDALRAADVVERMGYCAGYDQGRAGYELTRRAPRGAKLLHEIDLHWRIVNAPALAEAISFEEAWERSISLPALGPAAFGLGPIDALLHAAMNRTVNLFTAGLDEVRGLYDIKLLVGHVSDHGWDAVIERAAQAGLAGVLASALSAAQRELAASVPPRVIQSLRARTRFERLDPERLDDWAYMQRAALASLPWSHRVEWLRQRALPPVAFMRSRHGADRALASLLGARAHALLRRVVGSAPIGSR